MHKFLLIILLACCFVVHPAWAADDQTPETEESCDAESDESCAEEELDRGFDPCLINASLPACKSDDPPSDSGAAERASEDNSEEDGQ